MENRPWFISRLDKELPYPAVSDGILWEGILCNEPTAQYATPVVKVACWGILYNKKELGYDSAVNDAEVIARLYEQGGASLLNRLDGSFTFILMMADRMLVVRDHHGTNLPVYYNKKYIASSLSLLRQTEGCSTEPDYQSLSAFLSIGYIATPSSSFKDIYKLGAGEILSFRKASQERKRLFDISTVVPAEGERDLEALSEQYGQLHAAAIRRRIGSSQNVGILLSGGYDSGCNLAALRKIYTGDIHSFSIGFKGDDWTELPLARLMSDTFHTHHQEYEIDGSEITALPEIVNQLGDPFVEGGLMVNYAAMRMIGSQKPDVILGGDGSDQYFGTSGREVALHYLVAHYGLKPVFQLLHSALNHSLFEKDNAFYRLRFHLDKMLGILRGDLFGFPEFLLQGMVQDKSSLPLFVTPRPDTRSFAHLYTQHAYTCDLDKTINQVILFKASRMAEMFDNKMAFPYMDSTLYEFLLKLPVAYKCTGNSAKEIARGQSVAKFLLKYHYKPMLPEEITCKKKQGGFAPMPLFFKDNKQRARMADFLLSSSITDDYLNRKSLESFIRSYDREVNQSGNWFWYKQNKAIQYFNLLTLAVWWEQTVKGKTTVAL
ncbi:MAG: asparagine synthase-related protein [Tannerellaceae bacterium]